MACFLYTQTRQVTAETTVAQPRNREKHGGRATPYLPILLHDGLEEPCLRSREIRLDHLLDAARQVGIRQKPCGAKALPGLDVSHPDLHAQVHARWHFGGPVLAASDVKMALVARPRGLRMFALQTDGAEIFIAVSALQAAAANEIVEIGFTPWTADRDMIADAIAEDLVQNILV